MEGQWRRHGWVGGGGGRIHGAGGCQQTNQPNNQQPTGNKENEQRGQTCVPPETTVGAPGSAEPRHVTRPPSSAVNTRGCEATSNRPGPRHTTVCQVDTKHRDAKQHSAHTGGERAARETRHRPHLAPSRHQQHHVRTGRLPRRMHRDRDNMGGSTSTCFQHVPPPPPIPHCCPGGSGRPAAPHEWWWN